MSWEENAECRNMPDWWFGMATSRQAIRICRLCSVQSECLEYAMQAERGFILEQRAGVFGGLGPYNRHKLQKERETCGK